MCFFLFDLALRSIDYDVGLVASIAQIINELLNVLLVYFSVLA